LPTPKHRGDGERKGTDHDDDDGAPRCAGTAPAHDKPADRQLN
jgi:hypothetical protein